MSGRPANSRVRHGMASCARYGCQRPECREAQRRDMRSRREDLRNGRPATVSADAAARHLRTLVNWGVSPLDISRRSGVGSTPVRDILRGRCKRIYRVTEEALLGVPVPEEVRMPERDGLVDLPVGVPRRLQALAVEGFPIAAISREAGVKWHTLHELCLGKRPTVLVSALAKVRIAYDTLWDEDPVARGVLPSDAERARRQAEAQGWLPGEAWTDIDDPNCTPVVDAPLYMALGENAEELMRIEGYDLKLAAERLKVSRNHLHSALRRYRAITAQAS